MTCPATVLEVHCLQLLHNNCNTDSDDCKGFNKQAHHQLRMRKLLPLICSVVAALLACTTASVIPAHVQPLPQQQPQPTYTVASAPAIVTAHSHQMVARNHNRLYVPTYWPTLPTVPTVPIVPTLPTLPAVGAYSYATYSSVPTVYRYGTYPYTYYPAYGYSYATTW